MPTVTSFRVASPNVQYSPEHITSEYHYDTVEAVQGDGVTTLIPRKHRYSLRTERSVPKLGVMFVGWGGNNGSTVTAGILANKLGLKWSTKEGVCSANYFGSLTQASTVKLGTTSSGENVFVPFGKLLPMVDPDNLVLSGWDINGANLATAMSRAQVLPYDLQRQLEPLLVSTTPLKSIYYPDFIAANQEDRATHVLEGRHASQEHLDKLRQDIRQFKSANNLDKVIVLWTANTERFAEETKGVNDTSDNLLMAIQNSHPEIAPSQMFAVAAILEGCSYINGSPQNTFVPGVLALARKHKVFVGGDDFKSGQTKLKSVLVDFLVSAGIKPESIVSYNHLGNNDGKNLQAPKQFRSKEISKSDVVNDVVASNSLLFSPGEQPDHCVVIKYVPFVGDSKRALDEYTSSIFLNGKNTIVMHNTCEDSLLAAPLIIDLVILTELCERISYKTEELTHFERLDPVLSILSYLLKAPLVPRKAPVVNALFKQRACIENILKACLGLPVESNMLLEHKTKLPAALQ